MAKCSLQVVSFRPSLDDRLREILDPCQIRRAGEGNLLSCSHCGRPVEFTYRGVCGRCFLAGKGLIAC